VFEVEEERRGIEEGDSGDAERHGLRVLRMVQRREERAAIGCEGLAQAEG
jgi:hypothetical protein